MNGYILECKELERVTGSDLPSTGVGVFFTAAGQGTIGGTIWDG